MYGNLPLVGSKQLSSQPGEYSLSSKGNWRGISLRKIREDKFPFERD
jgi:hypothetical protein